MRNRLIERLKRLSRRVNPRKLCWYGALALLLVILGLASTRYRSGKLQHDDLGKQLSHASQAAMTVGTPEPWEGLYTVPEPTPEPTLEPLRLTWPVEGEIIGEYAPDALTWSETLNQWQTHPGIDIAAAAGEAVAACADGTVSDAWRDPLWGDVIEIEHEGGYVSTYANLSSFGMVAPGDRVEAGQIIGAVGDTADCEAALPWHVHFELRRDGAPEDAQKLFE